MNQTGQANPRTEAAGEQRSLGRVLVVDRPRFSELISRMLAGRMEVVCAEDALTALGMHHRNRPDLIVADLNVRGGGLRLAELLEMNVAGVHTPFILTCIKPQADLVDRVKQVGIDTLLVKPFPPRVLMERIASLLRVAEPVDEDDETRPLIQT
ncbi:MAG: response regulator, partial [Candidatus Latescibacteria bacterium]|nr:response regulator [Candidatus Latescibacterota bacterium]